MDTCTENIRVFDSHLAEIIGLNEAIVVRQVQYWIELKESDKNKYKDSYRDGYYWVYNSYEEWGKQFPFWSDKTIRRTIKKLVDSGILITGCFNKMGNDRTKWYRIDYDSLNSHLVKMTTSIRSNRPHGLGQNDPTITKEYTDNTSKKNVNGANRTENLSKQIFRCCKQLEISEANTKEVNEVITYYFGKYEKTFDEKHPMMTDSTMMKCVRQLVQGENIVDGIDPNDYEVLIDKYFKTEFPNECVDYHLPHFLTEGIINNRFYEELY